MATGEKAYLQDKNGTNLLVGTDWSMVQNKPKNLATTDQLPTLGGWQRDGIEYENGAYDWDHVNNGYNCAYRIADMGSFKFVELRMIFGSTQDIVNETKLLTLPQVCRADGNEEEWFATNIRGVFIHLKNDSVSVYCQQFQSGDKYTANAMLSFHTTYLSAL